VVVIAIKKGEIMPEESQAVKQLKKVQTEVKHILCRMQPNHLHPRTKKYEKDGHCVLTRLLPVEFDDQDGHNDPVLSVGMAEVVATESDDGTVIFLVGHTKTLPGVYRYPDGSGEPDDQEFIEITAEKLPYRAAEKVVYHAFHLEIEAAIEDAAYAQILEDEKIAEQWEKDRHEGKI
jgi:hypothetical protein